MADLAGAYVSTSSFAPWSDDALAAARGAALNLRTWGDGYGYVLVATGRMDAMVDPVAAYYDLAPMPVILQRRAGASPTSTATRAPATAAASPATAGSTTTCSPCSAAAPPGSTPSSADPITPVSA